MISILMMAFLLSPSAALASAADEVDFEAHLDAEQVVPPTASPGSAVVAISFQVEELSDPQPGNFDIVCADLSGPPTGVSIRWGNASENGPLALTILNRSFTCPASGGISVPWSVLSQFWHSDTLYVLIHTDAFPDGELRGQFSNVTPPAVQMESWGYVRGLFH